MKIFNGTSIIAMTAMERAAGRYLRGPDHSAATESAPAAAEPSPAAKEMDSYTNVEVNDAPPAPEGDNGDEFQEATDGEEGKAVKEPAAAAEGEEGGDGKPVAEDEEDAAKPKSTEERIKEITDGRREAERREAEATRQAEYWRGVAEGRKPAVEGEAPAGEQPQDDLGAEPDPEKYEYGNADARYIADLAAFEARKAVRQEREAARISERLETVEGEWKGRTAQAESVYPDFQEKVIQGADKGTWPCSQIMALAIKTSPAGADVAYHLANTPAEAARIAGLTPLEQAKEMGRLEYRFESEAKAKAEIASREGEQKGGGGDGDGSGKPAEPNKVSKAPPPPPRARGAGGKFSADGDTNDFRAFEAHADQVLEARNKRL